MVIGASNPISVPINPFAGFLQGILAGFTFSRESFIELILV
jgi:hypothetical protein